MSAIRTAFNLLKQRHGFFAHDAFDQDKFDQIMARPEPANKYVIFFTPRSGSTRITGLIGASGLSNGPREYFNDSFLKQAAANHSARNLSEYVKLLERSYQKNRSFGFEITYRQLITTILTGLRFLKVTQPHHAAWLIRASNLNTFRFSYEMTNALGPDRITQILAEKLGLASPIDAVPETHKKLPGTKANEFAERFRSEHRNLDTRIEKSRAPMLAKIVKQKELYL